jgi:hypothetical protein
MGFHQNVLLKTDQSNVLQASLSEKLHLSVEFEAKFLLLTLHLEI